MKKCTLLFGCLFIVNTAFANISGNALFFDGVDDFATIVDADHLEGMMTQTMELWFCPYDNGKHNILVKGDGQDYYTDRSYEIKLNVEDAIRADFFAGEDEWVWLHKGQQFIPGEWLHIAATYDAINQVSKLFLNGNLICQTHRQAGGTLPITAAIRDTQESMIFGKSRAFGLLDEVRIWNIARTDAQIRSFYNKKVTPDESGLIGYWDFDEALSNQIIVDSSAYHHNGVLGNSSAVESQDPVRIVSSAPLVPEPCSLVLLGLGGFVLRSRKRFC